MMTFTEEKNQNLTKDRKVIMSFQDKLLKFQNLITQIMNLN
jgi:hypothetical protein